MTEITNDRALLLDFIKELKESAYEMRDKHFDDKSDPFSSGAASAYYATLNLLRNLAESFGFDLSELELDGDFDKGFL